jgi:NitT/TauT family transport system substrate-binding protein
VLIAHPGQGNDSFAALRGKPIMVAADTRAGVWPYLKARFGYTDEQLRPYTFNLAPFLRDPGAIQQGYLGSEPFLIRQAGIEPVVLLLADSGLDAYGCLVAFSRETIARRPDLVRRFLAASREGWQSYLKGDPAPGNALIMRDNPDMPAGLIAYAIGAMNRNGIVLSGDALTLGIGAMTEARWQSFFRTMAAAGVYPPDLDWRQAFTLAFVGGGQPAE